MKKSIVKTMNQSISRFLGQLAKRFGEEEVQEVILQKPEQSIVEPKQAVTLQSQELNKETTLEPIEESQIEGQKIPSIKVEKKKEKTNG